MAEASVLQRHTNTRVAVCLCQGQPGCVAHMQGPCAAQRVRRGREEAHERALVGGAQASLAENVRACGRHARQPPVAPHVAAVCKIGLRCRSQGQSRRHARRPPAALICSCRV